MALPAKIGWKFSAAGALRFASGAKEFMNTR